MDVRRLRLGDWVVAGSGAVLLGSLFAHWYRPHLSAWSALATGDVILALIAVSALLLAVVIATQPTPALPIALTAIVALLGFAAALLALVHVLALPAAADGRAYGVYLALGAAVGIAAGGCIAIRDERLSPPGRSTDATGRPAPPPPEIEPLPPPGPRTSER